MNGLSHLKALALADSRKRYPDFPEYARCTKSYNDRSANGLTRCIIDYLRFNGWQAERISVTGRPKDNTKIVTDVIGSQRRIGSIQWLPGTMTKGSADISAVISGRAVKIEIKVGRDKQSEDQKRYEESVIRAGGLYWICHSFQEFLNHYNQMI
jgi:hypothetical protein